MLHFTNNKELQDILKFQVTKPRSLPYGEGPTDEIGCSRYKMFLDAIVPQHGGARQEGWQL